MTYRKITDNCEQQFTSISVVSSICHEKNGAFEISFSISLLTIAVIDSKISFCMVFDVPENTDLLSRNVFKLGSYLLKKRHQFFEVAFI
jgi:hypothetical protein